MNHLHRLTPPQLGRTCVVQQVTMTTLWFAHYKSVNISAQRTAQFAPKIPRRLTLISRKIRITDGTGCRYDEGASGWLGSRSDWTNSLEDNNKDTRSPQFLSYTHILALKLL